MIFKKIIIHIIVLHFPLLILCQAQNSELLDNSYNSYHYSSPTELWISSQNGWNRYDGTGYYEYLNNNEKLRGQWIQSNLYKDSDNNLWSSTYESLHKYSPEKDKFESFSVIIEGDTIQKEIRALYLEEGNLIIRAGNNLYDYEIDNHKAKPLIKDETTNIVVHHVYKTADGLQIIGGSWIVNQSLEFWTRINMDWSKEVIDFEICNNEFRTIQISDIQSYKDQIWLTSNLGLVQLNKFDPCESKIFNFNQEQISTTQTILFEDHLLITTDLKGLLIFDLKNLNFKSSFDSQSPTSPLLANNPIEIFEGINEIIIAFRKKGIQRISKSKIRSHLHLPLEILDIKNIEYFGSENNLIYAANDYDLSCGFENNGSWQMKSYTSKMQIIDVCMCNLNLILATDYSVQEISMEKKGRKRIIDLPAYKINRLKNFNGKLSVVASNNLYKFNNDKLTQRYLPDLENQVIQYYEISEDHFFVSASSNLHHYKNGKEDKIDASSYIYDINYKPEANDLILGLGDGIGILNLDDRKSMLKKLKVDNAQVEEVIMPDELAVMLLRTSNGLYSISYDYQEIKRISSEYVVGAGVYKDLLVYASETGMHAVKLEDLNREVRDSMIVRASSIPYENEDSILEFKYKLRDAPLEIEFASSHLRSNEEGSYTYQIQDLGEVIYEKSYGEKLKLPFLPEGKYVINLQGYNYDKTKANKLQLQVSIVGPIWKRWWFLLLSLGFISFLIWKYFSARTKRLLKEAKVAEEIRELEKAALQAQMNPHFIFNCLNSIQSYIMDNDSEKAMNYLGRFSKLIRLNLNSSVQSQIKLEEEIKILENYLFLEQLRLNNRFDFKIDYGDEIDIVETCIPPMLIQPFVENAVLHGMKGIDKNGLITINFTKKNTGLKVEVKDNGKPKPKASPSHGYKSLGTDITKKRLSHINGVNPDQVDIQINYSEVGTQVLLSISTA